MSRPKIFIASSSYAQNGPEPLDLLKKSGFEFSLNTTGRRLQPEELVTMAAGAAGIIAGLETYTDSVLERLPQLRCISRCGVGVDNIAQTKAQEKNIKVLITAAVVVQPVAELTVGLILDLVRNITAQSTLLKSGRWERRSGFLLSGKKIGILGLGRIGKRVAELLTAFGVSVLGADISPDQAWAQKNKVKIVSIEEMLKDCDVLCIHLSVLAGQSFRLGQRELASMKKGAFIVNVARGQFIDEAALYDALHNGHLGGAALDVFDKEPYAGDLRKLENVILTPHVGTLTQESRLQMEIEATQNLLNYLKTL